MKNDKIDWPSPISNSSLTQFFPSFQTNIVELVMSFYHLYFTVLYPDGLISFFI